MVNHDFEQRFDIEEHWDGGIVCYFRKECSRAQTSQITCVSEVLGFGIHMDAHDFSTQQ